MAKKIAVLTDEQGNFSAWAAGGVLSVYLRENGNWRMTMSCSLQMDASSGMDGLRRQMAEVIVWLDDCTILAAASVTGVPYFELEKAGVAVWELQGAFERVQLEGILQEEALAQRERRQTQPAIPQPEHLGNGRYRISIKEVQESGGATSKQVLQHFLEKGCYEEVEVLCAHVPPWLETMIESGNLCGSISKSPQGTLAVLQRTTRA